MSLGGSNLRIAYFVNSVMTEKPSYSTSRLALESINRGHEVWTIQADSFILDEKDKVRAVASRAKKSSYDTTEDYLKDLQGSDKKEQEIGLENFDVLFLRSDPSEEKGVRNWAQEVGLYFGRLAIRHGVIVVNDPDGLSKAINKTYLDLFPERVRPRNLITRNVDKIREFAEQEGQIVLKPLQGSGGSGVFLVDEHNMRNLNQIVESLSQRGYLIAQQFLPEAEAGDTRLFLLNGKPLQVDGHYAAFKRVGAKNDIRNNISAGGTIEKAEITDEMLAICEILRPKLIHDGMFLVGVDIVGNKLMEINVFSPGGLGSAQKIEGVDFTAPIIDALERKVDYTVYYQREFTNLERATIF